MKKVPPTSGGKVRLPDLGPRGEGWVIGQLALIALLVAVGAPGLQTALPIGPAGWVRFICGLAALAIGGWLVLRGLADLGDSMTPMPRPRTDGRLVETGVYRRIRHPVYAGLVCCGIGWSILTASPAGLVTTLVLAGFLDAKARREEAWLLDRYEAYADYRRRTSRFVPGIY